MTMAKIILCVDMDAFFAFVEQKDNPELRGKPIAVTGSGERTVVTTSSYEARAYGVKTGMTTPFCLLHFANWKRVTQQKLDCGKKKYPCQGRKLYVHRYRVRSNE